MREAGLDGALTQAAPAAAKRFVYWNGALHELPAKPPRALAMSLLSARGKLRALGDLFARAPARTAREDESVFGFAARHFGREVAERIVAPALLGISGGDAAATSVDALFPRLRELERAHGSVIRGMLRARAKPGRLSGFGADGMQRLTDRLAQMLGDRLHVGCAVERIEPLPAGWRIHHAGGTADADAVVVTAPAYAAANLVEQFDAELARELRGIAYAPMRVAGIAFRAQDVPHRWTASVSSRRAGKACASWARSTRRRSFPVKRRPAPRTCACSWAVRPIPRPSRSSRSARARSCAAISPRCSASPRNRLRITKRRGRARFRSTASRIARSRHASTSASRRTAASRSRETRTAGSASAIRCATRSRWRNGFASSEGPLSVWLRPAGVASRRIYHVR